MLDAGLAAGEAMWMGMNIRPLSLGGRGCWGPPWQHSSKFLLPDFSAWSVIDGAFLSGGTWGINKNSKEPTFKAVHHFFKHLRIHFFLCVWKGNYTQRECIITVIIYSWYNRFKWNWCIQRKISLMATQPLPQSSSSLVGYEAVWHKEMDSSRGTLVPRSVASEDPPLFVRYN